MLWICKHIWAYTLYAWNACIILEGNSLHQVPIKYAFSSPANQIAVVMIKDAVIVIAKSIRSGYSIYYNVPCLLSCPF